MRCSRHRRRLDTSILDGCGVSAKKKTTTFRKAMGKTASGFAQDYIMLIRLHEQIENTAQPRLTWQVDGHKTATPGALSKGAVLTLSLALDRTWGAAAVVCRIAPDGRAERDIPMTFVKTENGVDLYTLALDTNALCGDEESGLFYYELLLYHILYYLF